MNEEINAKYEEDQIPDVIIRSGNSFCFDCAQPAPTFASINNGIYLCVNCAEAHQALGLAVSLIRPLPQNMWSEIE